MNTESLIGYRPKIYTADMLDCPVIATVDVVVVGGSQSGVAAAVSCARAWKTLEPQRTPAREIMLIEQNTFLGGQSVTDMTSQWKINAFRKNVGKWRVKGIGYEMVERIVKMGGSDRMWEDLLSLQGREDAEWPHLGPDHAIFGEEALNIEAIKYGLMEMCEESGVKLLLDTRAVAPIVKSQKNGHPRFDSSRVDLHSLPGSQVKETILANAGGVVVEHARGRGAILAQVVIDATANADFSWWLGGEPGHEPDKDTPPGNWGNRGCRIRPKEKRGLTQSYLWIGGVDMKAWAQWVTQQFTSGEDVYELYPNNAAQFQAHVDTGRLVFIKTKKSAVGQPEEMWDAANEQEDLDGLLKSKCPFVGFYAKWCGSYPGHGVFCLDGSYYRWENLDGGVWSEMHTRNLHGSWGIFRVMRHMTGWQNAYIARTAERMGLRTTRLPNGIYRINAEDLRNHTEQPDAVGVGDWHDTSKESDRGKQGAWGYHVPLRSLTSNAIDNLLFCARAISMEDTAMNAHRTIGTTIVCAQGAGVAAAVCVSEGISPQYANYKRVQEILKKQNVIFDIPRNK